MTGKIDLKRLEQGFGFAYGFFRGALIVFVVMVAYVFWNAYSVDAGNGFLMIAFATLMFYVVRTGLRLYRKHFGKGDRK